MKKREIVRVETFIDKTLGIEVVLKNVDVLKDEKNGDAPLNINYNELADKVLKELVFKKGKLTGEEVKFLRKYSGKSLRELADLLSVSHGTVKIWEDKKKEATTMNVVNEKFLRSYCFEFYIRKQKDEAEIILKDLDLKDVA